MAFEFNWQALHKFNQSSARISLIEFILDSNEMGAFVVTVITVVVLAVTTTFVSSHNPLYQTHLQECVIQKIEADYNPEGHEFGIGNLSVYETQDEAPKRLLIAIYDIFGVSNNVKLFADKIAADYDFRVVVPDVFRGVPWDHTIWPPE